jgi:hypothetical protein
MKRAISHAVATFAAGAEFEVLPQGRGLPAVVERVDQHGHAQARAADVENRGGAQLRNAGAFTTGAVSGNRRSRLADAARNPGSSPARIAHGASGGSAGSTLRTG